jgi:hypothetical protein
VSLNDIKECKHFSGKGHNEILEIVNPLQHMMAVTDSVHGHVPENRGTRAIHIFLICQKKTSQS